MDLGMRYAWPPYLLDRLAVEGPESLRPPASAEGLQAALGTGPVTYQLVGAGAVVTNHQTGRVWRRQTSGRWVETTRSAVPIANRVAGRIRATCAGNHGESVATVLRQAITPWLQLLERGRGIAVDQLGVTTQQARTVVEQTIAAMRGSEYRPHQLVIVIDDPLALAAAFEADADLEMESATTRIIMRWAAATIRATGAGRWVMPGWFPTRNADAGGALVDATRARRPGQRFHLEPVPPAGRVAA